MQKGIVLSKTVPYAMPALDTQRNADLLYTILPFAPRKEDFSQKLHIKMLR